MTKIVSGLFLGLFFIACSVKSTDDTTIVGIQPYNSFSKEKAKMIAQTISDFYEVNAFVMDDKLLSKKAFINVKSPRYRADSIIALQHRDIPDSLDFIIGLTAKDISTTKYKRGRERQQPAYKYQDWGVMGLGYCPGNSCVVSTYRLQHKEEAQTTLRLQKVAVHEFGHNLGLPHCPDKKCVMTDAVEKIATIDKAKLALCTECKKRVQSN